MDQKHHFGWERLSSPGLNKGQLLSHFQQEYEVYVRDFPIFLARILGRMGADSNQLKAELAENLFEEQTGGLTKSISKGCSHPQLFLKMMKGLGFKENQFQDVSLLPTSLAYRCFLDQVTFLDDWRIGAAILTLFVEGSLNDRKNIQKKFKATQDIKSKLKHHALVKFYGVKTSDMDLVKVHHAVEGGHRKTAWEAVLNTIPKGLEGPLLKRMQQALDLWLLFRDGVCVEMGLDHPDFRELAFSK